MLFRLEDYYGLVPHASGFSHGLVVKGDAPKAKKLYPAIDTRRGMREKLEDGAITKEEYDTWKASFSGVEYGLASL